MSDPPQAPPAQPAADSIPSAPDGEGVAVISTRSLRLSMLHLPPGAVPLPAEGIETLQSLLGSLPGALYRCRNDASWTVEFMSRGVEALTGYPPEAFVERREVLFGHLIAPDDQERVREAMLAAMDERRPHQLEYRVRHRDGRLLWVWEQGMGLFDERGELSYVVGYISDVSARKRAEAALGEREAEIERKNEQIQRMMTPILEVDEGTLVVPLIGELGRERGERLLGDLLGQLRGLGARWVVVDVTGLAELHSAAAEALRRLEGAARLLGARCIVTGVRPQAAAALVAQGLTLGSMPTARTLKEGLRLRGPG